ncbi:MAG: RNA polymerase sigma factor [bacterium]|nr:RNA polymerase sigma factor [bacterium]
MPLDQEAFLRYYEVFNHRIYTYFWYRTGFRRETAEDLTQEVFLKAFQAFASFDCQRSFAPWIFRIAHNHLVNHYRGQRPTISLEEAPELPAPNRIDVEHRMEWERALRHLDTLPSDERDLLLLRYVDQLTHDEIADVVGKRTIAVRVAVHRATKRLRSALGERVDV